MAGDTRRRENFGALKIDPLVNIDHDMRFSVGRNRSGAQLAVATPNSRHALLNY
jgi:hypothetical protein